MAGFGASGAIRRRSFLTGLGAATFGAGLFSLPAKLAFAKTMSTGSADVTIVSDGSLLLPLQSAFPDAPPDELAALLTANGQKTDALSPDCNVTLVRAGDRLAIFDVGAGQNFMPSAGKLAESLNTANFDPADITDVVITHAHPDHIWGLTDEFDDLVFANATHHIGQTEWDFWSAEDAMSKVPEDRQTFVVGARNRFAAMGDNVRFLNDGDDVLPGVEAVLTPGHTPGHMSFMVHGSEPLMIVGDAISNAIVSVERPQWHSAADQDQALGAATRAKLLDRLAGDKARLVGFHFPHPGAGMIQRHDGGYKYLPS